jgi:hypothetical protein
MADRGLTAFLATTLAILLGCLLATHAYVELTHPATAKDAFSSGIAGVIQENDALRTQYEQLQSAAAGAPDQRFEVPGLGVTLSGAEIQALSFDEAAERGAEPVANALYEDGSSAARALVEGTDTSASPKLAQTSGRIVDNLDSIELGLGVVSDETNDIAETVRTVLVALVVICGLVLFATARGHNRLSAPGLATLVAALPYVFIFLFASQWFGPQEEPGLTENVRESLAPTVDGLFNTYLFVSGAGVLLLLLSIVWVVFVRSGQFGLAPAPDQPPRAQYPASGARSYRPARPQPVAPRVQEAPPAPLVRRRPPPWSGSPYGSPGGDGVTQPPPQPVARKAPFGDLLQQRSEPPQV